MDAHFSAGKLRQTLGRGFKVPFKVPFKSAPGSDVSAAAAPPAMVIAPEYEPSRSATGKEREVVHSDFGADYPELVDEEDIVSSGNGLSLRGFETGPLALLRLSVPASESTSSSSRRGWGRQACLSTSSWGESACLRYLTLSGYLQTCAVSH